MRIALGCIILFFGFRATAQNELPERIQTYFSTYQEDFPVEKAYLHLDKFTYTLGEDVWFSAYLVAGGTQVASPLSETLYVDFFDGEGLLFTQKVIQLENGRGAGDFKIPYFGKTGIYQIKAYTSWMKNFGEDYFFTQKFHVFDGLGGSFLPKIDFLDLSFEEGVVKYRVAIQAVNSQGQALSNQSIQVKAIGDSAELFSQDIRLNADGEIEFSFSIPAKPYPSQHLELNYEETDGFELSQKVRLPYTLQLADIQFLPEGGNWVLGKKSKVAFRAVDPDGTPVSMTGAIEDEPETEFSSNFAGLGKVEFSPQRDSYTALITSQTFSESRRIPLPKPLASGLALQVQNPEEGAFVSAFVQGNESDQELLLVSHTRGLINFMIKGKLTNGAWGARIPKKNLPSGINTITILDPRGKPLLERLVFIQNEDAIELNLTETSPISPRGKMSFFLESSFEGKPNPATYSIAVADAEQVKDESELYGTIFSHLLLSSDLKGSLHKPGYYFQNKNAETREALDLVMLTHGWSRFSWEEILNQKFPDRGHYIEQGITLKGTIKEQYPTKKGLGGGKISALIGEGIELLSSEYGPDGGFFLTDLQYQDSVTVTLTAVDQRAKNFIDLQINESKPQFSKLIGSYPKEILWPEGLISTVRARNLMQQLNSDLMMVDLEAVTIGAKTLQKEQTQGRKLYGEGDATLKPDEIPGGSGYINIFQMIQGRVAGVKVNFNGLTATVQIRGVGSIQAGTEPLYLLDNIPVDAGTLNQISPRDVESIEVFKDPARTAIFGSQGANGAIAVYTKTGAGLASVSVGGTLVTKYGGYTTPRKFYSPQYNEKTSATGTSDQRATIFWNPLLKTDEEGSAQVDFYNSDSAKQYLIVVEGMDSLGRIGRMVKVLE